MRVIHSVKSETSWAEEASKRGASSLAQLISAGSVLTPGILSVRSYRLKLKEWGALRGGPSESAKTSETEQSPALPSIETGEQSSSDESEKRRVVYGSPASLEPVDLPSSWSHRPSSPQLSLSELYDQIVGCPGSLEHLADHLDGSLWGFQDNILHYAASRDNVEALRSILHFMRRQRFALVHIHHRSSNDRTALEISVEASLMSNTEVLLGAGASVHTRNRKGQTALDLAVAGGASKSLIDLLIANGATGGWMESLASGSTHALL